MTGGRGADGGQQPGEGADDDGCGQAAGQGVGRDDNGLGAGVGGGGGRADGDSGGAAGQGQQDRLRQELGADLAAGGAKRPAQPDLLAA